MSNVEDPDSCFIDVEIDAVCLRPAPVKEQPDYSRRPRKAFDGFTPVWKSLKRVESINQPVKPLLSLEWGFFDNSSIEALDVIRRTRHQPNAVCHTSRACSFRSPLGRRLRLVPPAQVRHQQRPWSSGTTLRPCRPLCSRGRM